MNDLIPQDGLQVQIPEEAAWLANFVSQTTKRTYGVAVREFLAFHGIGEAEELRRIDQAHVIAFRDFLMKSGATPNTVHNRISALSSLFKHLCERQVVRINPTIGIRRPSIRVNQVKAPVLTPQQVRRMLDAPDTTSLKGCRDRAVLHILFYAGCRVSEVCLLKVKDFYEDGGYFVLDFVVKGGKRNRVAIHQELQIALRQYLTKAGHEAEKESPLVLPVQRAAARRPISVRQANNIFHEYAKRAGLPDGVTPHSARATFITQALERSCPIEAVQKSVGHSRISTTQMYDKRGIRYRESASFAVQY